MSARGQGCREYRALLAERIGHMPVVAGVSAAVLATWSIAAECAHEMPPAGLAWPALVLAVMLDHHGMPGAVLTSPAACGYIAGRPSTANGPDQNMVRAAINNLAQAGLVTIDPASPARTVQMHASVQAAVRAYLPPADLEQVVTAAADALLETWPDGEGQGGPRSGQAQPGQAQLEQAQLEQALDCAGTAGLRLGAASYRRRSAVAAGGYPLLFRAGLSLEHSRCPGGHHVLEVDGVHERPAGRPGPPGHPDRALQPGHLLPSRPGGSPTPSRSPSARWPTASVT